MDIFYQSEDTQMKKAALLLTILGLGAIAALFNGCGSSSTATKEKAVGSPNDPQFQAAQEVVTAANDYGSLMFNLAFQAVDSVFSDPGNPSPIHRFRQPVAAAVAADTATLDYHMDSQYWLFYTVHYDTTMVDTQQVVTRFLVKDSIQFVQGMDIVQWPDSALLTEFRNGVHISVTASNTTDSTYVHQLLAIAGDIPGQGDISVDGSRGFELNYSTMDQNDTCQFGLNMGSSANNVGLNLTDVNQNDGCPTAGNLVYTGNINVSCLGQDTLMYNDGWTITQTFNNDISNYVFENSTTRWTFADTCHTQPAAVSAYKRIARLQTGGY